MRPIGGELVTTITSPSCWGTHFIPHLGTFFPLFYDSNTQHNLTLIHFESKGSGLLEFGEFCQLAAKFLVEEDDEALKKELKEAFRIYDKDQQGYITTGTSFHNTLHSMPKVSKTKLNTCDNVTNMCECRELKMQIAILLHMNIIAVCTPAHRWQMLAHYFIVLVK